GIWFPGLLHDGEKTGNKERDETNSGSYSGSRRTGCSCCPGGTGGDSRRGSSRHCRCGGLSVRKRYPCSALGAPCSSEPFFLGRCWIDREHPSFLSREVPLPGEIFYMYGRTVNQ